LFLTAAGSTLDLNLTGAEPGAENRFRAAIIGHTGRGDYGHELDQVFTAHPRIELVAVADPVPAGRAKAVARNQAPRQYDDYHQMLERERPQLVAVGMRQTDQHHAAVSAALDRGAHVLMEKPITQTLAEADDLIARADRAGRRLAVMHQMRLSPAIQHLKKQVEAGLLGRLVSMQAHGKQDSRAGAEDLLVLGTHLFDMMRLFAGDPRWCTAQVLQAGHDITRADAHAATENIGPIAGDEIEATFGFGEGITATFTSRARLRQTLGPWSLVLQGEKGRVRILMDIDPRVFQERAGTWENGGATDHWEPLSGDPSLAAGAGPRGFVAANRRVLDDFLSAITEQREPACGARGAAKALEMAHGIFAAGLSHGRVSFPLSSRQHPLG
jgi:predicted dehydrogenase